MQTLAFILIYFVLKGFRNKGFTPVQTTGLNREQKMTARVIAFVVILGAVPAIAANIAHSETLSRLADICDLNFAMLLGIILSERLHLADPGQVLKKRLPFMLLVIISGMCMMIGIAKEGGVIQMLSGFLARQGSERVHSGVLSVFWLFYTIFTRFLHIRIQRPQNAC